MDYKYIEQLLERYWQGETTTEEESILRAFFAQDVVPVGLAKYKPLFVYQRREADVKFGDDFDERLCRLAGVAAAPKVVRARRVSPVVRLRPLYNAVAAVAIVMVLGTAANHVFDRQGVEPGWDYNANTYRDSYDNPQEAYETLSDGIEELKDVFAAPADTARADSADHYRRYTDVARP